MMKRLGCLLCFMSLTLAARAQNPTEARIAYQLAAENYEAGQYEEALAFLEKAESALGRINPPMAYLSVLIGDQVALAHEKTDREMETLKELEKMIADFENLEDRDALGEDKQKIIGPVGRIFGGL